MGLQALEAVSSHCCLGMLNCNLMVSFICIVSVEICCFQQLNRHCVSRRGCFQRVVQSGPVGTGSRGQLLGQATRGLCPSHPNFPKTLGWLHALSKGKSRRRAVPHDPAMGCQRGREPCRLRGQGREDAEGIPAGEKWPRRPTTKPAPTWGVRGCVSCMCGYVYWVLQGDRGG